MDVKPTAPLLGVSHAISADMKILYHQRNGWGGHMSILTGMVGQHPPRDDWERLLEYGDLGAESDSV